MKFIFSSNLRQGFTVNIFIGTQEANREGHVLWIDVATNISPDIFKWTIAENNTEANKYRVPDNQERWRLF